MVAMATNCFYLSMTTTQLNINYFFVAAITHTAQYLIFSLLQVACDKHKSA